MPTRNFKQYLIISAKGLAMGAADAVPGQLKLSMCKLLFKANQVFI